MRPIPKKMRDEIEASRINKLCALYGSRHFGMCSRKIEWHHVWIYAGRQINEPWAIVGACTIHHDEVKSNRDVKRAFERISLSRASLDDLEKYPKKDWLQIKKQLK